MTHRHLSEDELLDALLEGGGFPAEVGACPRCVAAAGELEAFLRQCRARAGAALPAPAEAAALVSRVLARTTREDLAWRGDVSLLADFIRQRLSASRGLRVAAASLLVHLLALPVFAWLALRPAASEHAFQAQLATREQALPAVPEEPERALESPLLPEPRLVESAHVGPALRRRLERTQLLRRGAPESAAAPGDDRDAPSAGAPIAGDPIGELLRLRGRRLNGELDPAAVRAAAPPLSTALERALWVEILMDHLVLAEERLPALEANLKRVGSETGLPPSVRRLERLVLERAAGLELLDAAGRLRLDALEGARGEGNASTTSGQHPSSGPGPIGARGFGRALGAVLGERAGGWADWDR